MDDEIIAKWFSYWCPLVLGFGPNAHANGLTLTLGVFWARAKGGYNLYRWTGEALPTQPDRIVGAAASTDQEVANFPLIEHEPSTIYWYLLRAVGGGGVEESTEHQLRKVEFDANGDIIGPRPNAPSHLSVDLLSGGRFCLRWAYDPASQEISPDSFEVYNDSGSPGEIDYDSAVGSADFAVGQAVFEWTSEAFDDGTLLWWAVRAKSRDDVVEENTVSVAGQADTTGPPVHPGVVATRTEDMP